MNAALENSMVVNAADDYERSLGQEFPHVRRARLRFSPPDLLPSMPLIEVEEPALLSDQAE